MKLQNMLIAPEQRRSRETSCTTTNYILCCVLYNTRPAVALVP